ncbi:MAG: hypothetical protein HFE84_11520 [Lachnospiraceae bacterium]|nr:hypothetical protein [Lachnospiraceae bacterium]
MKFFNKLEQKYARYAVPDLMRHIGMLYTIGILIQIFMPGVYENYLCLNARAILHGQVWRIVTFLIWPPISVGSLGMGASFAGSLNMMINVMFNMLLIYCYRNLGLMLERVWGAFRFNVYFILGVIGHVLAALILYAAFGKLYILTTDYLNFSLFFAVAIAFPEMQFFLFFAIPIKAKWLALFNGAFYLYGFIAGSAAMRVTIAMSLLNVLIFLAISGGTKYNPKEIKRKHEFKTKINENAKTVRMAGRHRCVVCGRTDLDHPELTFRYCSKCEGDYEYCQDHLYTHQHVTRGGMDPRQAGGNVMQFDRRQ